MFIMHLYKIYHCEKMVAAGICMRDSLKSIADGSEKSNNRFMSMQVDMDTDLYKLSVAHADKSGHGRMSYDWWATIYDFVEKQNEKTAPAAQPAGS